jgi:hypothetical protein
MTKASTTSSGREALPTERQVRVSALEAGTHLSVLTADISASPSRLSSEHTFTRGVV